MAVALGVNCKTDEIPPAVARDGAVADGFPEKLRAPALLEETERLAAMLDDVARVFTEVSPDVVRVLMAEQTYEDSYARIAPRVAPETLVRLAAHRGGTPVELLHHNTARAHLRMPKRGRFDAQLPDVLRARAVSAGGP